MEEHKHHEHHKEHEHVHHAEHKRHEGHGTKPNTKLWVMAIALGLLIILSAVQAVELVSLKNKLNKDLSEIVSSTGKKTISTSSGSLDDNLKNLPSMVGGC